MCVQGEAPGTSSRNGWMIKMQWNNTLPVNSPFNFCKGQSQQKSSIYMYVLTYTPANPDVRIQFKCWFAIFKHYWFYYLQLTFKWVHKWSARSLPSEHGPWLLHHTNCMWWQDRSLITWTDHSWRGWGTWATCRYTVIRTFLSPLWFWCIIRQCTWGTRGRRLRVWSWITCRYGTSISR